MTSVQTIKFLDKYVGFCVCLVLSFFNIFKNTKQKKYKRIALVQLWGVGETILTLPAIRALRQRYKDTEIDILTTTRVQGVFYSNKNISDVRIVSLNPLSILMFALRNWNRYDLVIDMEEYLNISTILTFFVGKQHAGYSHGIRGKVYDLTIPYNDRQHVAQTFADLLRPLGIRKKVDALLPLQYSKQDKKAVESLFKKFKIKKNDNLVGLGIGAAESAKSRMWPAERFAEVADHFAEKKKAKIIFVGSPSEKGYVEETISLMKNKNAAINMAGKTTVRQLFYLIEKCKLFIGNDSGPMHIAAAQGVKTIGLFGCNLPVRFRPLSKVGYALDKKKNKIACINVHKGEVNECRFGMENACVRKISVNDVIVVSSKVMK